MTLRLVCVVGIFIFQQQKMRKRGVLWGVWLVDTPCMCRVGAWRVYVRDLHQRLSGIA